MSTPQWYLAVGSEQVGPVTEEDIVGRIKDGSADAQTLAFIAGMQRLKGDGLCFVNAGGMLTEMELGPGETLRVDTGCLVALQPTVNYDVQFVGGVKTAFFGGEGLFFTTLTGPGRVWLQSLPLSRLAGRIYRAAPQTGGSRKGEGSILDVVGGIGNLIDGD